MSPFTFKLAKRSIAIALSLCLLWTSGGVAEAAGASAQLAHPAVSPMLQLAPPAALGRIVDSFETPQSKTPQIILIQDLHAHYGVQKNIAGILDFLTQKINFKIAVEGAFGPIDSSMLALFPDEKIKQAAADYLMQQGELAGPEYFAVMHRMPQALTGVEDLNYYLMHRNLFRKTLADRDTLVHSLKTIQGDIAPLRKKLYSRHVRHIQRTVDAFEKGDLAVDEYIHYLASEAADYGLPLQAGYPLLARFLEDPQGGHEAKLDYVFHEASELAFRLKLVNAKKGPEKDLVQVEHDLALLLRVADLQATELEVRDFAPRINPFIALAQSLSDKKFDETKIRQLISSSVDYYVMALMRNQPMVDNTLKLITAAAQNDGIPEQRHTGTAAIGTLSNKNILSRPLGYAAPRVSRPSGMAPVAVLVAGGFHTASITQILRENKISYLVISPAVDQITDADHALYIKRLSGQLLTIEEVKAAATLAKSDGQVSRWTRLWRAKELNSLAVGFDPMRLVHGLVFALLLAPSPQALEARAEIAYENSPSALSLLHEAEADVAHPLSPLRVEPATTILAAVAQDNRQALDREDAEDALKDIFSPERLMEDAKDLSAPAKKQVQKAATQYFRVPKNYKNMDFFAQALKRLNRDLDPLGYVGNWWINPAGKLEVTFYAFDQKNSREVPLRMNQKTFSIKVYSARFASGSPEEINGLSLHDQGKIFIMDDTFESQVKLILHELEPSTDLKALYSLDNDVARTVLQEAFGGKTEQEIRALYRQEIIDHEVLHAWFDKLADAKLKKDLSLPPGLQTEFASYLGGLAFARSPYRDLLQQLESLTMADNGTIPPNGNFRIIADLIFRTLMIQMHDRLQTPQDQQFALSTAKRSVPLAAADAATFFTQLRRSGVTEQELRDAIRAIYEASIGPLVSDLKPLASLFENSPTLLALESNDVKSPVNAELGPGPASGQSGLKNKILGVFLALLAIPGIARAHPAPKVLESESLNSGTKIEQTVRDQEVGQFKYLQSAQNAVAQVSPAQDRNAAAQRATEARKQVQEISATLAQNAKDLTPAGRAAVQKIINQYFRVPSRIPSTYRFDVDTSLQHLNDALVPMGYVVHAARDPKGSWEFIFFSFDKNHLQQVRLNSGNLTGTIKVYSAHIASGAGGAIQGFSLPGKGITFIFDETIRLQVQSWIQEDLLPNANLEANYGTNDPVVREILNEALGGKSAEEIQAIHRQEVMDHEVLHQWFDMLPIGERAKNLGLPENLKTEYAAYFGTLAFSRYPYRDLLLHVQRLTNWERGHHPEDASLAVVADATFRGLADELAPRLPPGNDQQFALSVRDSTTLTTVDRAVTFISMLRRNGITDQDLRNAVRAQYEREIGPLTEDLKPVASLFENSPSHPNPALLAHVDKGVEFLNAGLNPFLELAKIRTGKPTSAYYQEYRDTKGRPRMRTNWREIWQDLFHRQNNEISLSPTLTQQSPLTPEIIEAATPVSVKERIEKGIIATLMLAVAGTFLKVLLTTSMPSIDHAGIVVVTLILGLAGVGGLSEALGMGSLRVPRRRYLGLALFKLRFTLGWLPRPSPNISQEIDRWKDFTPTVDAPAPMYAGGRSADDALAVLAGRKPAAHVPTDVESEVPGLLFEARRRGITVNYVSGWQTGDGYLIGDVDHVRLLTQLLDADGVLEWRSELFDRAVGRLYGYPSTAIEKWIARSRAKGSYQPLSAQNRAALQKILSDPLLSDLLDESPSLNDGKDNLPPLALSLASHTMDLSTPQDFARAVDQADERLVRGELKEAFDDINGLIDAASGRTDLQIPQLTLRALYQEAADLMTPLNQLDDLEGYRKWMLREGQTYFARQPRLGELSLLEKMPMGDQTLVWVRHTHDNHPLPSSFTDYLFVVQQKNNGHHLAARAVGTPRPDRVWQSDLMVTYLKNEGLIRQAIKTLLSTGRISEWQSSAARTGSNRLYEELQKDPELEVYLDIYNVYHVRLRNPPAPPAAGNLSPSTPGSTFPGRLQAVDQAIVRRLVTDRGGRQADELKVVVLGIGKDGAPTVSDHIRALADAGFSHVTVIGVDANPDFVTLAQNNPLNNELPPGTQLEFKQGDENLAQLGLGNLDLIIAVNVLSHYSKEREDAIRSQLSGSLKEDGLLVTGGLTAVLPGTHETSITMYDKTGRMLESETVKGPNGLGSPALPTADHSLAMRMSYWLGERRGMARQDIELKLAPRLEALLFPLALVFPNWFIWLHPGKDPMKLREGIKEIGFKMMRWTFTDLFIFATLGAAIEGTFEFHIPFLIFSWMMRLLPFALYGLLSLHSVHPHEIWNQNNPENMLTTGEAAQLAVGSTFNNDYTILEVLSTDSTRQVYKAKARIANPDNPSGIVMLSIAALDPNSIKALHDAYATDISNDAPVRLELGQADDERWFMTTVYREHRGLIDYLLSLSPDEQARGIQALSRANPAQFTLLSQQIDNAIQYATGALADRRIKPNRDPAAVEHSLKDLLALKDTLTRATTVTTPRSWHETFDRNRAYQTPTGTAKYQPLRLVQRDEPNPDKFGKGVIPPLKKLFMRVLSKYPWGESVYDNVIAPILEEIFFTAAPLLLFHGVIPALLISRLLFIVLHLFGSQGPPNAVPRTWYEKITIPAVVSIVPILLSYALGPTLLTIKTLQAVVTVASILGHSEINVATPDINRALNKNFGKARLEFPERSVDENVWSRSDLDSSDFEDIGPIQSKNIYTHSLRQVRDKKTGEILLLKRAPEHAIRAELIGQRIFEYAGLPVARMRMMVINGEPQLLIERRTGLQEAKGNNLPKGYDQNLELQSGALLDLLIYNYDRTPWNLLYAPDTDDVLFIDFGAALMARAQGGFKGFPPNVSASEFANFLKNPQYPGTPVNQAYANALASRGDGFMASLEILEALDDAALDRIVDEAYADESLTSMQLRLTSRLWHLGDISPNYADPVQTIHDIQSNWGGDERAYLKSALKSRRDSIITMFSEVKAPPLPPLGTFKELPPGPPTPAEKGYLLGPDSTDPFFKHVGHPELPTQRTHPPTNRDGMDVTEAYLQGMPAHADMLTEDEIKSALYIEVARLAADHPDADTRLALEQELRKITRHLRSQDYHSLQLVARIMAGVMGYFRKNDPDRFIVHFARDMGFTLAAQQVLDDMNDLSDPMGGALYLNTPMMGPAYESLRTQLRMEGATDEKLAQSADAWFTHHMARGDIPGLRELAESTWYSLARMGALDHDKVMLFDTGERGTMPWFAHAVIRYFDRQAGRETPRDIQVLLVHSNNSTRKVDENVIGILNQELFGDDMWSMLEQTHNMMGILENLGHRQAHPVWFNENSEQIIPETPVHQLQFFFARLVFQNMAIAEHLAQVGLEELGPQPDAPIKGYPQIPGFKWPTLPGVPGQPNIPSTGFSILSPEILASFAQSTESTDKYLSTKNIFKKESYTLDSAIWESSKPDFFKDTDFWQDTLKMLGDPNKEKKDLNLYRKLKKDYPKLFDWEIKPKSYLSPKINTQLIDQWHAHQVKKAQIEQTALLKQALDQIIQPILFAKPIQLIFKGIGLTLTLPKRNPYGLTGLIAGILGSLTTFVLYAQSMIPYETMIHTTAGSVVSAILLWAIALHYKKYLAGIRAGDRIDPTLSTWETSDLTDRVDLFLRDTFGRERTQNIWNIRVVNDIQDMSPAQFMERFPNQTAAAAQFKSGLYYEPITSVLFVNNFGKPGTLVNNAAYEWLSGTLYVHMNAARSTQRSLGLVLAHEIGKKAFFNSPLASFIPSRTAPYVAELSGNIREFLYFIGVPFNLDSPRAGFGTKILASGIKGLTRILPALLILLAGPTAMTDTYSRTGTPSVWLLLLSMLGLHALWSGSAKPPVDSASISPLNVSVSPAEIHHLLLNAAPAAAVSSPSARSRSSSPTIFFIFLGTLAHAFVIMPLIQIFASSELYALVSLGVAALGTLLLIGDAIFQLLPRSAPPENPMSIPKLNFFGMMLVVLSTSLGIQIAALQSAFRAILNQIFSPPISSPTPSDRPSDNDSSSSNLLTHDETRIAGYAAIGDRMEKLQHLFAKRAWDDPSVPVSLDAPMSKQEREYRYLLAPNTIRVRLPNGSDRLLTPNQGHDLWIQDYFAPIYEAPQFETPEQARSFAASHTVGNPDVLKAGAEKIHRTYAAALEKAKRRKDPRDKNRAKAANMRVHIQHNAEHRFDQNALTEDEPPSVLPPEFGSFDETMTKKGWGVLDTRESAVGNYVDELSAGYKNVYEKIGKDVQPGMRFVLDLDGSDAGQSVIHVSPEASEAVRQWVQTTADHLRELFPDENLEIENISLSMGWNLKGKVRDEEENVPAHIDGIGTYLHATDTLQGASSYLYPDSKHEFFKNTPLSKTGLGTPVIPPTGTTVVITGLDRSKALKVPPTMHSSPLEAIGDPNKRITLFLGIKKGKPVTVASSQDRAWQAVTDELSKAQTDPRIFKNIVAGSNWTTVMREAGIDASAEANELFLDQVGKLVNQVIAGRSADRLRGSEFIPDVLDLIDQYRKLQALQLAVESGRSEWVGPLAQQAIRYKLTQYRTASQIPNDFLYSSFWTDELRKVSINPYTPQGELIPELERLLDDTVAIAREIWGPINTTHPSPRTLVDQLLKRLPNPEPSGLNRGIILPLKNAFMSVFGRYAWAHTYYDDVIGPILEELLFTALPLFVLHVALPGLILARILFIALHLNSGQAPPNQKPQTLFEKLFIPTLISLSSVLFAGLALPSLITITARILTTAISTLSHGGLNRSVPILNQATGKNFSKAIFGFGGNPVDVLRAGLRFMDRQSIEFATEGNTLVLTLQPSGQTARFEAEEGHIYALGRSLVGVDVTLTGAGISRKQLEIRFQDGMWEARNTGTTNPTLRSDTNQPLSEEWVPIEVASVAEPLEEQLPVPDFGPGIRVLLGEEAQQGLTNMNAHDGRVIVWHKPYRNGGPLYHMNVATREEVSAQLGKQLWIVYVTGTGIEVVRQPQPKLARDGRHLLKTPKVEEPPSFQPVREQVHEPVVTDVSVEKALQALDAMVAFSGNRAPVSAGIKKRELDTVNWILLPKDVIRKQLSNNEVYAVSVEGVAGVQFVQGQPPIPDDELLRNVLNADPDLDRHSVQQLHGETSDGEVDMNSTFSHVYAVKTKNREGTLVVKVAGGIQLELQPKEAKETIAQEAAWIHRFQDTTFAPRLYHVYANGEKQPVSSGDIWTSIDGFSRENIEGKLLHQALRDGDVTREEMTRQFLHMMDSFEKHQGQFNDYKSDAFVVTPTGELKLIDFGMILPLMGTVEERQIFATTHWNDLLDEITNPAESVNKDSKRLDSGPINIAAEGPYKVRVGLIQRALDKFSRKNQIHSLTDEERETILELVTAKSPKVADRLRGFKMYLAGDEKTRELAKEKWPDGTERRQTTHTNFVTREITLAVGEYLALLEAAKNIRPGAREKHPLRYVAARFGHEGLEASYWEDKMALLDLSPEAFVTWITEHPTEVATLEKEHHDKGVLLEGLISGDPDAGSVKLREILDGSSKPVENKTKRILPWTSQTNSIALPYLAYLLYVIHHHPVAMAVTSGMVALISYFAYRQARRNRQNHLRQELPDAAQKLRAASGLDPIVGYDGADLNREMHDTAAIQEAKKTRFELFQDAVHTAA